MPKAYIIQDQKSFDAQLGNLSSKDYSDAERYGELKVILENNATPFDLPPVVKRIHEVMAEITEEDWLIPVGNPILIGLCVAIAADYLDGKVKMLQWAQPSRSYIPITLEGIYGS